MEKRSLADVREIMFRNYIDAMNRPDEYKYRNCEVMLMENLLHEMGWLEEADMAYEDWEANRD